MYEYVKMEIVKLSIYYEYNSKPALRYGSRLKVGKRNFVQHFVWQNITSKHFNFLYVHTYVNM